MVASRSRSARATSQLASNRSWSAKQPGSRTDILRSQNDNLSRKLADSGYLLWHGDYNQLMHLGRYLTWTESDSTQRFPGIHEPPQWLRCRLSSARD